MPTIEAKHIAVLVAYAVITALINLIFSKKSQIDEWCEANPTLAALAKFCRGAGVDPWSIFQSVVLAFTKKLPGYQKQSLAELSKPKAPSWPPMGPMGGMFMLLLAFPLSCGFTHDVLWPIVKDCAPSPASLLNQVENVLLAGGDVEAGLIQLAETAGKHEVVCAVEALTGKLGKIGASPAELDAAARGKAFLVKTGNDR